MALTDIGADIAIPTLRGTVQSLAFSTFLLNAAGEKAAWVFQIRKGGTIDKVGFCTGTVTTPQTLKVSLQDVDLTTGNPDGTADEYRTVSSPATGTYYETGLITSDGTDGGTKRTVSAGDLLAIVVEFDSTTGNLDIVRDPERKTDVNFPYTTLFTSSWSKAEGSAVTHIRYSDGSFEQAPTMLCAESMNTTAFNSGSTPDEYALKFTMAFDCRIIGCWFYGDLDNDADLVLYDAASSVLTTLAVDPQVQINATNGRPSHYYFDTAVEYTKATAHRLALKPGASNSSIFYYTAPSTPGMAANELGTNFILSTRTDAGAWTDDTLSRPYMGLILDQVHDDDAGGGGGGGLITHPGMQGNING